MYATVDSFSRVTNDILGLRPSVKCGVRTCLCSDDDDDDGVAMVEIGQGLSLLRLRLGLELWM